MSHPVEENTAVPETAVDSAAGKVRAVVAKHVEELTRFDSADLSEGQPECDIAVPLELELVQTARFEIWSAKGAGGLSPGTDSLDGAAAMNQVLTERLRRAQSEAPTAMERWAKSDTVTYQRELSRADAFVTRSKPAGYEHACYSCKGACNVTCTACNGRGKNDCFGCYGSGKKACGYCHGSKSCSCNSCGGSGGKTEYVTAQHWNSSSGQYEHSSTSHYATCSTCSGSGRQTCNHCDYLGKVACNSCWGNGTINCGACSASGKVRCVSCNATGKQHEYGAVNVIIDTEQELTIACSEETINALVRAKIDPAILPTLGELLKVEHEAYSSTVHSTYAVRLDVLQAHLSASDMEFNIYGFGPVPTVFDFQNIAGHLLKGDLLALEECVQQSSGWFGKRNAGLLEATGSFLRSELNMLIAEQVSDAKAAPDAASTAVQDHFKSLVETSYIDRTSAALRTALKRVYSNELAEPAAYLCAIAALSAAVMTMVTWPFPHWLLNSVIAAGAGASAWFVLEWHTRRRIVSRFGPAIAERVIRQIHASGSVGRWRIGIGVAGALTIAVAAIGTIQVPYVRSLHEEKFEIDNAAATVDQWLSQSQNDWQQRTYPSRRVLEHEAGRGNRRAQVIMGWQFLLGADGAPKDVRRAGEWLDKAGPFVANMDIWKSAKAIQVLHEEATPEQLRAASATLRNSADKAAFVEARFWEARTYLDERSALYDLAHGNNALRWAAEKGHAHAALMLGQNYAIGRGVKRDPRKARQYLQIAAQGGLTKASEALANLK